MKQTSRRLLLIGFWVSGGVVLASIVGMVLNMYVWAGVVFGVSLTAMFAFGFGGIGLGVSKLTNQPLLRMRPEDPPSPDLPRILARVESVHEAGLTVRNFNHLYRFVVTVLPASGHARREEFTQFITMGQLPNFYTGRYVVLATSAGAAGSTEAPRLMLDPAPSPTWQAALRDAPSRYDDVVAPPPPATSSAPGGQGRTATLTVAPTSTPARRALNLVLVATCVAVGFVGTFAFTPGGLPYIAASAAEIPDRITGRVHGLWDSRLLAPSLEQLARDLDGRQLEDLSIYGDYIVAEARSTTDPEGRDNYVARHGALELSSQWTSTGPAPSFTVVDVSPAAIRTAVGAVYASDPDAVVSNVAIRPFNGTSRLVIVVTTEGEYESETAQFDMATGEPVGE